jgi:outer membrane murein-binding lipoprotein Lpp
MNRLGLAVIACGVLLVAGCSKKPAVPAENGAPAETEQALP